ncbi:hypothetical protein HK096_005386, partial [Nowakowskiella sp. JEL0078]
MPTTIVETITTVTDAGASSSSVETVVQTIETITESTPLIETIKTEVVTSTSFSFFSCFGCGPKPADIAKEIIEEAQDVVAHKAEETQESVVTVVETVQESVQESVESVVVVPSVLSTIIKEEPSTGTDETTETIETIIVETVSAPEVVRNSSSEDLKNPTKRNSVSSVKNVTTRVSSTIRGIGGRLKTIGRPKSVVILEDEVTVLSETESLVS